MMEEGQALDVLIAERIMGWRRGKGGAICGAGYESSSYWYDAEDRRRDPCTTDIFANMCEWSPSTDIAAAWAVVEQMQQRGYSFCLYDYHRVDATPRNEVWHAIFINYEGSPAACAKTTPLAICKAALKAIGHTP